VAHLKGAIRQIKDLARLVSNSGAMHVRKATRPEAHHHKINTILGLSSNPGGTHRVLA